MSSMMWSIPEILLPGSVSIMRPHGAAGNEGLALWFGVEEGQGVRITHLVDVTGEFHPVVVSLRKFRHQVGKVA